MNLVNELETRLTGK